MLPLASSASMEPFRMPPADEVDLGYSLGLAAGAGGGGGAVFGAIASALATAGIAGAAGDGATTGGAAATWGATEAGVAAAGMEGAGFGAAATLFSFGGRASHIPIAISSAVATVAAAAQSTGGLMFSFHADAADAARRDSSIVG